MNDTMTSKKLKQPLRLQFPVSRWTLVKKSIIRMGGPVLVVTAIFIAFVSALTFFDALEFESFIRFITLQKYPFIYVAAALLIWLTSILIYQYLYFKTYFYDCDEENLYIRNGVIIKKEIVLPFARITDVYLEGDLMDVIFGLRDLHFSTPTIQSGKLAHIDGLSKHNADLLEKILIEKVNLHPRTFFNAYSYSKQRVKINENHDGHGS